MFQPCPGRTPLGTGSTSTTAGRWRASSTRCTAGGGWGRARAPGRRRRMPWTPASRRRSCWTRMPRPGRTLSTWLAASRCPPTTSALLGLILGDGGFLAHAYGSWPEWQSACPLCCFPSRSRPSLLLTIPSASAHPRLLAYAVDTVGGEKFTLHVRDLKTGRELLTEPVQVRG